MSFLSHVHHLHARVVATLCRPHSAGHFNKHVTPSSSVGLISDIFVCLIASLGYNGRIN